jgi:uncharacterized protein RhaS with RHS repeats
MYLHARYFDPQLGTFLNPDPIGVEGGLNLFGYAGGDPVNHTDRTGLFWTYRCVEHTRVTRGDPEKTTVCGFVWTPDPAGDDGRGKDGGGKGGGREGGKEPKDPEDGDVMCSSSDCDKNKDKDKKKEVELKPVDIFRDPCSTGWGGRFADSMAYVGYQSVSEASHYAELAEVSALAALATAQATYAEGMRRFGGTLMELAPGGLLGPAWLKRGLAGDAGAAYRAAHSVAAVGGVVGTGWAGAAIFAAAWDATTSGCR